MRGAAAASFLVALLALPLAHAGGPAPSHEQLTALAPILVEPGGSATLARDGLLLLRGDGSLDELLLQAERLRVTLHRERVECLSLAGIERCAPVAGSQSIEVLELTGATLRAKGAPARDFEAVVTLRAEHLEAHADADAGTLALRHEARAAELDVASRRDARAGATAHAPQLPPHGPAYAPRPNDFALVSTDARATAEGRFAAYLAGIAVHLVGTDEEGRPVDRVVVTGSTRSATPYGGSDTVELLVAEAAEARLDLRWRGASTLLGRPLLDAPALQVVAAAGGVHVDGARREVGGDARIVGAAPVRPVSFRIDGPEEAWIVLHTAPPAAVAPARAESAAFPAALLWGAAGGAAAGALASLALVGAWRWGELRYAAAPLVARLYSRIARDEVLDHRHREAILRAVREAPGVTVKELATASELAWTTVAHHLRRLEGSGLVVLRRDGRRMRFYAVEAAPADLHAAYAALRNPTSARLAELVARAPGLAQKDACEALGLSPSLLAWHAARLEAAGVIIKTKERGRARYHPGPAWHQVRAGARVVAEK
ncbi:MAG TPA: winged helix-turn-helix transcriptional regulator [Candidatus Thermoplasmatota archaeon]|nr:winged helix-turn-helix transcriptional regulator [Candidatus Thermoplasmatota archaeon]